MEISVYRCKECKTPFTLYRVKTGEGCPRCGHRKLSPTNPSFFEKLRLLPEVWKLYKLEKERTR